MEVKFMRRLTESHIDALYEAMEERMMERMEALEKNKYKLIEQGENITSQLSFSHVEGSRAYFFDGKDYSFLDIIGSEKSFNQDRIDLTKE